ncbi:MAG TPA: ABC transporter permease [Methylomirabilota bacterium]|jgi:peptide/nickel transport system permease protein|nr:ABC transporter permease [Methylomirabilota bacterium]
MSSSIPVSVSPERRRRLLGRLTRSHLALVGLAIVGLTAMVGLLAPLVLTTDPVAMDFGALLRAPSRGHLLGTDQFGRDVLARLVWGARLSVRIGALAVALAVVVGVPIGALSGYAGGVLDNVLMRCMDALLAFPALLLALGLVAIMGPGSTSTWLAIGIVYTPGVARLTRGVVLAERPQEYVQAARALGQRDRWVLVRHIMPNCVSALLVQASVNFANAMVIEAGLSFLGIGTPPPTPSWGLMLNEARAFMGSARHVAIAPGVAISLAVLGWNLLGDGLRDALDPRLTE